MGERNIRLLIEYVGTAYSGWQSQAGPATIQDEVTAAIEKTTGRKVKLIGAGRTDAGVHALRQVANFLIDHSLEPSRYRDALNYYLPDDILIKDSHEVPLAFHARYGATCRRYRYLIGTEPSVIYRHLRWHQTELDFASLQEAAGIVCGEHDFSAFCVVASRKENNLCRIDFSRWFQIGPLLVYEIRGNRFLHRMVRSLVGAMVNLAKDSGDRNPGNLTLDSFRDIILAPDGRRIVFTAPAHGLYLVSVGYKDMAKI